MVRFLIFFQFIFLLTNGNILAQTGEEMFPPENIGGKKELNHIIERELYLSPNLLKEEIKGTVKIGFTVTETGSIENINFISKVHPELDQQTLRIFKSIIWKPGVVLGKIARTTHTFEISYSPKSFQRLAKKRGYENPGDYPLDADSSMKIYEQAEYPPLAGNSRFWLNSFLSQNLKYPTEAFNRSIAGTVMLTFIIEPHGRISNLEVISSVGGGCDEEAIRLLSLIKWQPAKNDSKTVRYKMSLPITFNLN